MNTCTAKQVEDIPGTRIRMLVVDDSPFMLKVLALTLEAMVGFDLVGTATDGRQALRYVSMLSPDLVLMDLHMPGLNGIEATRYIKDREHPPVVIIITSDDSSVAKATAEEAGADAFVVKQGDLRYGLIGTLQNLFGPSGARRAAATDISVQNPPIGEANRITAHEPPRAKPVTDESSNQSLESATHSRNCALPSEFSPLERRALRHPTP
jgi:CheY-like chemotaxis protein